MKILADLHHDDLFRSLQLLGGRMGATFYRPKGLEWFENTFWHVHRGRETAEQFLGPVTYPDFPGISLEEAQDTKWDAVVVSHFSNLQPWQGLFARCQPDTPVVLQVGNNWNYNLDCFRNADYVLNSTATQWPNAKKHVRYHPEFRVVSSFDNPTMPGSVYSVNHYPTPKAVITFEKLREQLPGWKFDMFGCGTENGHLTSRDQVDKNAASYQFLFQFKAGGDGYGFNIHRAWAHNTPVIMDYNHYADKMAAMCMVDRETSFDLSIGVERVAEQIKEWSNEGDYMPIMTPAGIWKQNCCPDYEWNNKLKPFFEAIL